MKAGEDLVSGFLVFMFKHVDLSNLKHIFAISEAKEATLSMTEQLSVLIGIDYVRTVREDRE